MPQSSAREQLLEAQPAVPAAVVVRSLLVLCAAAAASTIALLQVRLFVPLLPFALGMVSHPWDVGYYTGLFSSLLHLGRLCSCYACGALGARLGTRRALMAGLAFTAAFTLGLGLAPSYAVALALRFLAGLTDTVPTAAAALFPQLVSEGPQPNNNIANNNNNKPASARMWRTPANAAPPGSRLRGASALRIALSLSAVAAPLFGALAASAVMPSTSILGIGVPPWSPNHTSSGYGYGAPTAPPPTSSRDYSAPMVPPRTSSQRYSAPTAPPPTSSRVPLLLNRSSVKSGAGGGDSEGWGGGKGGDGGGESGGEGLSLIARCSVAAASPYFVSSLLASLVCCVALAAVLLVLPPDRCLICVAPPHVYRPRVNDLHTGTIFVGRGDTYQTSVAPDAGGGGGRGSTEGGNTGGGNTEGGNTEGDTTRGDDTGRVGGGLARGGGISMGGFGGCLHSGTSDGLPFVHTEGLTQGPAHTGGCAHSGLTRRPPGLHSGVFGVHSGGGVGGSDLGGSVFGLRFASALLLTANLVFEEVLPLWILTPR